MKIKYVLLPALLTITLALSIFARYTYGDKTKSNMRKDISKMMGKPTVDATVEGLHMKIWVMTQEQHKKLMNGKMSHTMADKDMKEMEHKDRKMKDSNLEKSEIRDDDDDEDMEDRMEDMKEEAEDRKEEAKERAEDMREKKHEEMEKNEDRREAKYEDMKMDEATKKAMMAGTHHIMVDITDAKSGKEIDNARAKIMIVSPSKKNSSVTLKPMMNHFGDGLSLDEKGEYELTISVSVNGVSKTKEFEYRVW